jgi:hypothetical protein
MPRHRWPGAPWHPLFRSGMGNVHQHKLLVGLFASHEPWPTRPRQRARDTVAEETASSGDDNLSHGPFETAIAPLTDSGVGSLLDNAGWSLESIRDVSSDYERWYRNFAARIHDLQPMLVQECGIETWEYAVKFYDIMYETVQTGNMGGAIVYAAKRG